MRIIAGTAGRIAIKVPPAVTRPTTDFVRQAVFSILGERVGGARVLDKSLVIRFPLGKSALTKEATPTAPKPAAKSATKPAAKPAPKAAPKN